MNIETVEKIKKDFFRKIEKDNTLTRVYKLRSDLPINILVPQLGIAVDDTIKLVSLTLNNKYIVICCSEVKTKYLENKYFVNVISKEGYFIVSFLTPEWMKDKSDGESDLSLFIRSQFTRLRDRAKLNIKYLSLFKNQVRFFKNKRTLVSTVEYCLLTRDPYTINYFVNHLDIQNILTQTGEKDGIKLYNHKKDNGDYEFEPFNKLNKSEIWWGV